MATPTPQLPPGRTPGRYAISVVCLGNICRSPTAEVVLTARLREAGLGDRVSVDSSGLGDWHVGLPMDARAAQLLDRVGYDPTAHRAQQIDPSWVGAYDLVLAMDRSHLEELREAAHSSSADSAEVDRVRLFRDFDPDGRGGDVPDPYYGGDHGFEEVLRMIERTSEVLVAALHREYAHR